MTCRNISAEQGASRAATDAVGPGGVEIALPELTEGPLSELKREWRVEFAGYTATGGNSPGRCGNRCRDRSGLFRWQRRRGVAVGSLRPVTRRGVQGVPTSGELTCTGDSRPLFCPLFPHKSLKILKLTCLFRSFTLTQLPPVMSSLGRTLMVCARSLSRLCLPNSRSG
jgi:hypothetical protein